MRGPDRSGMSAKAQAEIQYRRIDVLFRAIPATAIVNMVIMLLIDVSMWGAVSSNLLLAWNLLLVASVAGWMVLWLTQRNRKQFSYARMTALERWLELFAGLRGFAWGVGVMLIFPSVDPTHQLVIALTAVSLMGGSVSGLATVPYAALSYSGLLGFGMIAALMLEGGAQMLVLASLTVAFLSFIILTISQLHRSFVEQIIAKLTADEQRQTIAILLKEFEESSSDWLWHTDASAQFIKVGDRFVQASGLPKEQLVKLSMSSLFCADPEKFNAQVCQTGRKREIISGVPVCVQVGGKKRYWSLSASPQWDDDKHFLGYNGVAADITEKYMAEQSLRILAHTDELTGLTNRARFLELLVASFESLPEKQAALIILDLDGFKVVNDTFGHPVGDRLLERLAGRLKGWTGENVCVSRLGGDEFAVLIQDVKTPERAQNAASELLELFEAPFEVFQHSIAIGACAGIALNGTQAATPEKLMKHADLALYAAKADGRGKWHSFETGMLDVVLRRQRMERELASAIDRGEFSLMYQPIIDARTGEVAAYEALLRWNSVVFGNVSPEEFIPVAEESGQIAFIGNWVLQQAAQEATKWPRNIQVCVNVSPAQLHDSKFLSVVVKCLDDNALLPRQLVIEITEGVFLEKSEQISRTLRDLITLGVGIALDDFGTGYSSLSYLRSFPFSKLKIDKSFVDDIHDNPAHIKIIKAIVDLASALGFEVVAEGVETQSQFEELKALNCDFVQGYLFSKPLAATDIGDQGKKPDARGSLAS